MRISEATGQMRLRCRRLSGEKKTEVKQKNIFKEMLTVTKSVTKIRNGCDVVVILLKLK